MYNVPYFFTIIVLRGECYISLQTLWKSEDMSVVQLMVHGEGRRRGVKLQGHTRRRFKPVLRQGI